MATILNIDTSTEVCSVSLSVDGKTVQVREDHSGKNHALQLTLFTEEVLSSQNITIKELQAVAVSGGPGSYTGLRIGVSTAKGLCFASGLPLIAIPSLESMAGYVAADYRTLELTLDEQTLLCPMIDARRMEVYTAVFNPRGEQIRRIQADVIDNQSFLEYLEKGKVVFFGNGSQKCRHTITHPNAIFLNGIYTSASHMSALSEKAFNNRKFVDIAYYEPFYLKDFIATVPTKNIFKSSADH